MKKAITILIFISSFYSISFAQSASCETAQPFCSGVQYGFPMQTNIIAQSGPNYGCMFSQPNPMWYFLRVTQSGDITIYMNSPTGNDIDFACWGPFNDPVNPCSSLLTANCTSCPNNTADPAFYPSGNMVDCSYDPAPEENIHISNAIFGKYYLICLTNFSNTSGDIIFEQSNLNNPNCGRSDCMSYGCYVDSIHTNISSCDTITNTVNITGEIFFSTIPDSGMLYIKNNLDTIFTTPLLNNQSPITFSIDSIYADGYNHSYLILITPDYCYNTFGITASTPCSNNFCEAGNDFFVCGNHASLNATIINGYSNSHWHSCPGITFGDTLNPNSTITTNILGSYSLVWENTNQLGHTNYDTVNVEFRPYPSTNFTISQPICFEDSAITHFIGIYDSTTTYTWDFDNGTANPGYGTGDQIIRWDTSGSKIITLTAEKNGCIDYSTYGITIPNKLIIQKNITTINCTTGSTNQLSFNTLNATNPVIYSYLEPDVPPFSTGIYHVIATDNRGCTAIDTFLVNSNTTIISSNIHNVLCNGGNTGAIATFITTPNPPITYHWSNNATTDSIGNLTIGTYNLTITDSQGCISNSSFSITQPLVITNNYTRTNPTCYGYCDGKIILTPTGGTSPYRYLWNNGDTLNTVTNKCSGNYTVTVSDQHHCTKVSTISLTNPSAISVTGSISKDCDSTCNGEISLSVLNYYSTYSCLWSNGGYSTHITNLCSGNYTVTITDAHQCKGIQSFNVTTSTNTMNPSYNLTADSSCLMPCSGSVIISPNGGTSPYKLHYSTTTYTTFTGSSYTLAGQCPGNYDRWISDANNCVSHIYYPIDTIETPVATAITPQYQSKCQNESIILNAFGTGDTSYWNNSIINNNPFTLTTVQNYNYTFTTINNLTGCKDTIMSIIQIKQAPSHYTYTDKTVCYGIPVTLYGHNGTSYIWSNNVLEGVPFIPTSTNFYYVTVTNAYNCSIVDSAKVIVRPNPVAEAGNNISVCQNTPVILNATGGNAYYWNNGVSQNTSFIPVLSGYYTVTVVNSYNCTSTDSLYLTVNPATLANAGQDTGICIYHSIVLMATGGISYSWSNGVQQGISFTPITSEYYYVTVVDANNCSAIDSVYIAIENPVIDAGNDIQLCYPDTIILHATASEGTISWNNAATQDEPFIVSQSSVFVATVMDSIGCTNSDLITVNIVSPQTPVITFSNDTLYSSIQSGNQWYDANGIISGANNNFYVPLTTGNYYVINEIYNCLSDTSNHIFVDMSTVNHFNREKIRIYPNPANEYLIIENHTNLNECIIYNSLGQKIESLNLNNSKTTLQTLNLSNGVYFIVLQNKDSYYKQIFEIKK